MCAYFFHSFATWCTSQSARLGTDFEWHLSLLQRFPMNTYSYIYFCRIHYAVNTRSDSMTTLISCISIRWMCPSAFYMPFVSIDFIFWAVCVCVCAHTVIHSYAFNYYYNTISHQRSYTTQHDSVYLFIRWEKRKNALCIMNSRLPLCKWVAYASESWVFVATIEKRKRRRARDTARESDWSSNSISYRT